MTPKEKAENLIKDMFDAIGSDYSGYMNTAKELAFICVDEIIEALRGSHYESDEDNGVKYWLEVRKEIERL